MKKISVLLSSILISMGAFAQTPVKDTITTGASYANDVWYNLKTGTKTIQARANWDIAFEAVGFTTAIHINSGNGVELYQTNLLASSFNTKIATSALTGFSKRWNSDTSWNYGAFNLPVSSDPNDLGWGVYNSTTHIVSGDSIFVIKLANGQYRKLLIESLNGGVYNFKYDTLAGTSGGKTASVTKADYKTKNFGYYSIQNNAAVDREPASADWDLLFTKYTTFIPVPYGVTGILQNKGVTVQQANNVADPATAQPTSAPYSTANSTIGWNWKTYVMSTNSYAIGKDTVYFVTDKKGSIWKLQMKGFTGGTLGKYYIEKTLIKAASIKNNKYEKTTIAMYPNPATAESISIIYNAPVSGDVQISISDFSGKIIYSENSTLYRGTNNHKLSCNGIASGMYIVNFVAEGQTAQQKLIIK